MDNLVCPITKCGGELKESKEENTITDLVYYCTKCNKRFLHKTISGKAAQVAPLVLAGGILFKVLKSVFDPDPTDLLS